MIQLSINVIKVGRIQSRVCAPKIMKKTGKRKRVQQHSPSNSIEPKTTTKQEPYPSHLRPTVEECRIIRDDLLAVHGFPQEFVKYRDQRLDARDNVVKSEPLDEDGEVESVLDGLIKTVLSQNTTEANSLRAFASLKSAFPTWEQVSICCLSLSLVHVSIGRI